MNKKRERFIDWIGISISLPEDRLTEMFYFDKKRVYFFLYVSENNNR